MFEQFYGSVWQHPILLLIASVAFIPWAVRTGGALGWYLKIVLLGAILDPLATGPITAALGLNASQANGVMIVFVVLGDLRLFFLLEYFGGRGAVKQGAATQGAVKRGRIKRGVAAALGLALVVPVLQALCLLGAPSFFEEPRHTFLVYELLFLGLLPVYWRLLAPKPDEPHTRTWLRGAAVFAGVYYALWALADVVILLGYDVGFLLRVVPNVLYYSLLLPFVFFSAPEELKS